jgi:uncharacterized protein (TIGR02677 family)
MSEAVAVHPVTRLKALAYVTAEKATLYRAIMRVFMESKERFALHLRPQEIIDSVQRTELQDPPDQAEIESALEQLCEWGNLQTRPDTTDISTVEDFYKQRYSYHITNQGEAAERSLELFQANCRRSGELQTNTLLNIRSLLHELNRLSKQVEPDAGKIHRNLLEIRTSFENLTSRAQTFMTSLQRNIDLQKAQTEGFTADTQRLIDYVERFLSELVIAAEDVRHTMCEIEASGVEKLFSAAAENGLVDAFEKMPEDVARVVGEWRSHWNSLWRWFVPLPSYPSHAEILRARARTCITDLLGVITSVNDRRISRVDRSNDFRVLARWFAQAGSDAHAHRLWRAVFGLSTVRHLMVNEATLDEYEVKDVPPNTSWLDAPPLRVSPTLRTSGSYSRMGRLSRIIDRTAEKQKLATAAHHEAMRILSAQSRFAPGQRLRLSDLNQLETNAFEIFLDLLGEGVSAKVFPGDTAEVLSNDGSLKVKLEPTGDGQVAVIQTPEGTFAGPDHWISVGWNANEEVMA